MCISFNRKSVIGDFWQPMVDSHLTNWREDGVVGGRQVVGGGGGKS